MKISGSLQLIFLFLFIQDRSVDGKAAALVALLKNILNLGQTFPTGDSTTGLTTLNQLDRRQDIVDPLYAFPCNTSQRLYYYGKPDNVSDVGAENIDVVAAIGDSVTAGTGVLSQNVEEVAKAFPQATFNLGGLGTWREYLTIPNILKEFNPRLKGFSTGTFTEKGFNFAVPGSSAPHMSIQAVSLVKAMMKDREINFAQDWKMVWVMVGGNDMCQKSCVDADGGVERYMAGLTEALEILYSMPRVIIVLVSVPDPSKLTSALQRPLFCQKLAVALCPCTTSASNLNRNEFLQILDTYRSRVQQLVNSGRYSGRSDRGLIYLKSIENINIPQDKSLRIKLPLDNAITPFPDLSYLAPDCFHLSQKMHAMVAEVMWREMFLGQEEQQGSSLWDLFLPSHKRHDEPPPGLNLYCPTNENRRFNLV